VNPDTERLLTITAAAQEFLLQHTDLPGIRSMELYPVQILTGYAQIEMSAAGSSIESAVAWADRLGVPVQFEEASSGIACQLRCEFQGYSIRIRFAFLKHGVAWRLLGPLGVEVPDRGTVEVDPARLAGQSCTQDGA
jgi:hypothetical protein